MTGQTDKHSAGIKFGPVNLTPGITRGNMFSLMWGGLTTIGLLTFVAVATPYVLTVNLGIPESEQGTITGDLVFWAEIMQAMIFGLVGVAAGYIGTIFVDDPTARSAIPIFFAGHRANQRVPRVGHPYRSGGAGNQARVSGRYVWHLRSHRDPRGLERRRASV